MSSRTFIYHNSDRWYCAVPHNPVPCLFNAPLEGQSSDVFVRLLAQQLKLGKDKVIAEIDDGSLISNPMDQPLRSGKDIWDELFETSTELYIGTVRAWAGRNIAEEVAAVSDGIETALLGALVMERAQSQLTAVKASANNIKDDAPDNGSLAITNEAAPIAMFRLGDGSPYVMTITNGIMSTPMGELTLIDSHLFDSWLVTKSQSPPSHPLRHNDSATLSWSYFFSWLTSGGIQGFYDGWLAYQLPNGRAFAVRVHVPTQVRNIGTRPSYMTAVNIFDRRLFQSDRAWTYHDDPSKPYTFPESEVGEYEITITPNSGPSSLLLDVQVTKKLNTDSS